MHPGWGDTEELLGDWDWLPVLRGSAEGQTQGEMLTLALKGNDLFWVGSDCGLGGVPRKQISLLHGGLSSS